MQGQYEYPLIFPHNMHPSFFRSSISIFDSVMFDFGLGHPLVASSIDSSVILKVQLDKKSPCLFWLVTVFPIVAAAGTGEGKSQLLALLTSCANSVAGQARRFIGCDCKNFKFAFEGLQEINIPLAFLKYLARYCTYFPANWNLQTKDVNFWKKDLAKFVILFKPFWEIMCRFRNRL